MKKKIQSRPGSVAYEKNMHAWNISRIHCCRMRDASGLPKYIFLYLIHCIYSILVYEEKPSESYSSSKIFRHNVFFSTEPLPTLNHRCSLIVLKLVLKPSCLGFMSITCGTMAYFLFNYKYYFHGILWSFKL